MSEPKIVFATAADVDPQVLNEVITKLTETWDEYHETQCGELDTGACTYEDPCDGCALKDRAWVALPDLQGFAYILSHPTDYTPDEIRDTHERWRSRQNQHELPPLPHGPWNWDVDDAADARKLDELADDERSRAQAALDTKRKQRERIQADAPVQPHPRIEMDADGQLDELFTRNADAHIERMDASHVWIRINDHVIRISSNGVLNMIIEDES